MRSALCLMPLLSLASPGFAGLSFCNQGSTLATVAIGYKGDGGWTSEGWWRVDPGDCREVISGDLTKRYYYWRATTQDGAFPTGDYGFCTQSDAFTIVGDQDCDARGYRRQMFDEVEVGTANDHTVHLLAQDAPQPDWAPDSGPGTYGEPLTLVGYFNGCWSSDEVTSCEVHADGWTYIASEEGPTDPAILQALPVLPDGMRLTVQGDLIAHSGTQAQIMIRDVSAAPPRPTPDLDGLLDHLQGVWDSDAGDSYAWIVQGTVLQEIHDANLMRQSHLQIAPHCAASDGQGPVIIAWPDPDPGDGPACFLVTELAQRHLVLRDMVHGQFHSFTYSD